MGRISGKTERKWKRRKRGPEENAHKRRKEIGKKIKVQKNMETTRKEVPSKKKKERKTKRR
jgi:hypothetical protein